MNRKSVLTLLLLVFPSVLMLTGCGMSSEETRAMELVSSKVPPERTFTPGVTMVTIAVDAVAGGYGVLYQNRNALFWTDGETVYTVNEKAEMLAPELSPLPNEVPKEEVLAAFPAPSDSRNVIFDSPVFDPAQLTALMQRVEEDPEDVEARAVLIHSLGLSPDNNQITIPHILYLIEHHPDIYVAGSTLYGTIMSDDSEALAKATALWNEHVTVRPEDMTVVMNAAEFLMHSDSVRSQELLRHAAELQPQQPGQQERLARLMAWNLEFASDDNARQWAPEAYAAYKALLPSETDFEGRISLLEEMGPIALAAGQLADAESHALALIAAKKRQPINSFRSAIAALWNRDQAWDGGEYVYAGHMLLGRVALQRGEIDLAKAQLREAAAVSREHKLSYFDQDFSLCEELLKQGQREPVLEYLDKCGADWDEEIADVAQWRTIIETGGLPEF